MAWKYDTVSPSVYRLDIVSGLSFRSKTTVQNGLKGASGLNQTHNPALGKENGTRIVTDQGLNYHRNWGD